MKTIHIAETISDQGREGTVEAEEGKFSVKLSKEDGGITPEHLFGGAYAACYLESLKNALEKSHLPTEGTTVMAKVHLEENDRGDYRLNVELRASLPGVKDSDAEHVMNLAHQSCPYSKATRGNVTVTLAFD